jgi:hypothetical protein
MVEMGTKSKLIREPKSIAFFPLFFFMHTVYALSVEYEPKNVGGALRRIEHALILKAWTKRSSKKRSPELHILISIYHHHHLAPGLHM